MQRGHLQKDTNKPRVTHVYKDFFPPIAGGIERHLNLLCRYSQDYANVQVLVANRRMVTELESSIVPVWKVGQIGRFLSAPLAPTFPLWLRRLKSDILHFHLPNPTADLSFFLSRPSGGVVATYHSDIVRQKIFSPLYSPFLRWFLDRCDRIIVTTPENLKTTAILKEFRHKCRIIPLGIDTKVFSHTSRICEAAKTVRKTLGEPLLLFVGKFRHYKGVEYLLVAMKNIKARLFLVGDGPLERELRSLTHTLGLEEKVEFKGPVSDEMLAIYLHACDIFVLPSINRAEAFGISMLEAMACGKPVVSTDLGTGVNHVNLHEKTGFVVPPCDSVALAKAINRLLDNEELRMKMGEVGRKRVESEFTADKMARRTIEVYKEVLDEQNQSVQNRMAGRWRTAPRT